MHIVSDKGALRCVIICSVDTGKNNQSYAILEYCDNRVKVLQVETFIPKSIYFEDKLLDTYNYLNNLFNKYGIEVLVYEDTQPINNAKDLNRVIGVLLLQASVFRIPKIIGKSATNVKKIISKSGTASKEQVAFNVSKLVGINKFKTNHDSDAIAVGLAYLIDNKLITYS